MSSLNLRVVSQFGAEERLQEEWNVGRVTPGLDLSDFFLEDLALGSDQLGIGQGGTLGSDSHDHLCEQMVQVLGVNAVLSHELILEQGYRFRAGLGNCRRPTSTRFLKIEPEASTLFALRVATRPATSAGLRHCGFLTCPARQGKLRDAASLCVLALPPAALDQP